VGNNVGVEHRENIFASTAYCLWCARRELAFTAISITYPSEPEKKVPIRPKGAFRDSSRAFAPVIASYEPYARPRQLRRTRHHLGRKTFKQISCLLSGLAVTGSKGRMLPGFWRESIPTAIKSQHWTSGRRSPLRIGSHCLRPSSIRLTRRLGAA